MPPMYNVNESYYGCGVGCFVGNFTPPTKTLRPLLPTHRNFNPSESANTFIKMYFVLFSPSQLQVDKVTN